MFRSISLRALKVIGLVFCLFGVAQVEANELECAGLISVSQHAAECEDSQNHAGSPSECCHVCTSQPALALMPFGSILPMDSGLPGYMMKDEAIPDGPVRAIDYPPQLS